MMTIGDNKACMYSIIRGKYRQTNVWPTARSCQYMYTVV